MSEERFFAATMDQEGLRVRGLEARDAWDPDRLEYSDTVDVDLMMGGGLGDRKIDTRDELRALLTAAPDTAAAPRKVWIHERYMDDVRRYHERRSAGRP